MELGKLHVIDVSESTIRALKIVALICLLLLCVQIVKAYPTWITGFSFGKNKDRGGFKNVQYEKVDKEKEKKYWDKVAKDIDKEFPSDKKKTGKKNKVHEMVADKNIKIKKKPVPVATIVKSKKDQEEAVKSLTNPYGSINLDDSELLGKNPKKKKSKKKNNEGNDENSVEK